MATNAVIDLKNFTPNIIKDQPLWEDFLDVVSDELDLVRTEIELKQRLFETDQYTEANELVDLAKSLGYSPNLILNDDLDYVRSEVDSIIFKIKNKATYAYYNYLFKLIPREGQVYILFQDSLTLARAIDYVATYAALAGYDIATPFTGMRSILHYNSYLDFSTQLDLLPDPLILDEDDPEWFLDQDIVIKPTQHLAIEYQIGELVKNEADEDVLLTSDYFSYMYVGVEYGRKVTNVPHIGINVSIPIGNTGFANELSVAENIAQGTEDEQYTIPALKIHAAVTQLGLTDFEYKYLAVGTGTKGFYNTEDAPLLTDLDVSMSFENNHDTTVFTDNNNSLEAIVVAGTHTVEDGISGKTIGWNGTDTEVEIAGVSLGSTDREFTFWVNADDMPNPVSQLIYIPGYLSVYYDTTAEEIRCVMSMVTGAPVLSYPTPLAAVSQVSMINIQIAKANTVKLYVDDVEVDSIDITATTLASLSNESIFLGVTDSSTNFFKGKLDEFKIYSRVLQPSERTVMYERKLGTLNYLSNEVYRKEISDSQLGESAGYRHAVSTIPANTINDEIVFHGDDVTVTINGTLEFPNISPGYVHFDYYSFPNFYTAKANERGQIFGDAATGTIDFVTGVFQLITFRDYPVNKELIFTGTTSTINHPAEFANIVPSSATLHYIVNGTAYAIQDDGAGNFTHAPTLTTATIVYSTGVVQATFANPTEASPAEIYLVYDYRKESTPTLNENVSVEYKLEGNIPITEVALLNENGEALVYANIPKVEYDSVVNHTGFQFFIQT